MSPSFLRRLTLATACVAAAPAFSQSTYPYITPSLTPAEVAANYTSLYALNATPANHLQLVNDPVHAGRKVLLATIDYQSNHTDINLKNDAIPTGYIGRWYAMSFYLPPTWADTSTPVTVMRIDKNNSSGQTPFALMVRNDQLEMRLNYQAAGDPYPVFQSMALGKVTKAKWYCMVFRVNWSATVGGGKLQAWLNGSQVYESSLAYNTFDGAGGHVAKVGPMVDGPAATRQLYMDFVWQGANAASRTDITNKTPCATGA